MNATDSSDRLNLTLDITWSRDRISHLDRFYIHHLNPWRDLFPGSFLPEILDQGLGADTLVTREVAPGILVPPYDPARVYRLDQSRLDPALPFAAVRQGRFYPQGLVRGIPGVFKGNPLPFRCLEKRAVDLVGDFNHPMAEIPVTLTLVSEGSDTGKTERGGSCRDWMAEFLTGPGMQSCNGLGPVDFLGKALFDRQDSRPDKDFYATERLVHHIDDTARSQLARWYEGLLKPGDRVLDLMAGWASHLPATVRPGAVHGLGLNAKEMAANPQLDGHTVHDLNQNPALPFGDQAFDLVLCSLSVEYLTQPLAVFREVGRVLRPGGIFALSFSNRWFPEKAIAIWPGLHEFERMGLVLDYFTRAGGFKDLSTWSLRGYPRLETDRYYPGIRDADPLFGVAGIRAA